MPTHSHSRTDTDNDYWKTLPLGRGVTICARDACGLVAFSKPAGTLAHPNISHDRPRSLLTARYDAEGEYFEWPDESNADFPRRLWLLNRLDSATSGVILAAGNEKLAKEIRALFQQRQIHKTYVALVFGLPSEKKQFWRDYLVVKNSEGQIRADTRGGNIPAESRMTVLNTWRDHPFVDRQSISLIQLEPTTGRSHQLRVQCAKRGLPIVGDATYGGFRANRDFAKRSGEKRLFLHSLETRFDYTHEGRTHTFVAKAKLPTAFLLGET